MKHHHVKVRHDDGDGEAEYDHHRSKPRSKPTQEAMPAHFVYADQSGLKDEKHYPARKCRAVNP